MPIRTTKSLTRIARGAILEWAHWYEKHIESSPISFPSSSPIGSVDKTFLKPRGQDVSLKWRMTAKESRSKRPTNIPNVTPPTDVIMAVDRVVRELEGEYKQVLMCEYLGKYMPVYLENRPTRKDRVRALNKTFKIGMTPTRYNMILNTIWLVVGGSLLGIVNRSLR